MPEWLSMHTCHPKSLKCYLVILICTSLVVGFYDLLFNIYHYSFKGVRHLNTEKVNKHRKIMPLYEKSKMDVGVWWWTLDIYLYLYLYLTQVRARLWVSLCSPSEMKGPRMKRYATGSLQGTPEGCGFAWLRPGSAILGHGFSGYLGSSFSPIDSHYYIKFQTEEFELKKSFRESC